MHKLAEQGKAPKTRRNIAEAVVSFCRWCVKEDILDSNPLEKLETIKGTPEVERRPFNLQEIYSLLQGAVDYMQLLYIVAKCTGLRANELRALTRAHLDGERGGLWLQAKWTKSRKPTFQPLDRRLVRRLAAFYESGIVPRLYQMFLRNATFPPGAPLFVPTHPARSLDKDLAAAGIPNHTADGNWTSAASG